MFVAISATIMPMFEKVCDTRIKTIEGFIWARFIIALFKGSVMMMVFIINGVANDFYIGFFFFFTTVLGFFYFLINPYEDPRVFESL